VARPLGAGGDELMAKLRLWLVVAVGVSAPAIAVSAAVAARTTVAQAPASGARPQQALTWSGSLVRQLRSDPSGDTLELSLSASSATDSLSFGLSVPGFSVTSATLDNYAGSGTTTGSGTNSCSADRGDSPETPSGNAGVFCMFSYQQVTAVTITLVTSPCYPTQTVGGEAVAGQGPESSISGPSQVCPPPRCASQQSAQARARRSFEAADRRALGDARALLADDRRVSRAGASLERDLAAGSTPRAALRSWISLARRGDTALKRLRAAGASLRKAYRVLVVAQGALASCEHRTSPASARSATPSARPARTAAARARATATRCGAHQVGELDGAGDASAIAARARRIGAEARGNIGARRRARAELRGLLGGLRRQAHRLQAAISAGERCRRA
jgi:hypothetical protein